MDWKIDVGSSSVVFEKYSRSIFSNCIRNRRKKLCLKHEPDPFLHITIMLMQMWWLNIASNCVPSGQLVITNHCH